MLNAFPFTRNVTTTLMSHWYLYSLSTLKMLLLATEAVIQRCSVKKVFFEISRNSQENTCARVSFLIKLQASATGLSLSASGRETQAQVFSCEFFGISKNTLSYRTPLVAATACHQVIKFYIGGKFIPREKLEFALI